MATILLVGVDLFLRGKLEGLLPGHRFVTTEGVDPPDLVIADIARIDPDDVADNFPEVPLLGFQNHTTTPPPPPCGAHTRRDSTRLSRNPRSSSAPRS